MPTPEVRPPGEDLNLLVHVEYADTMAIAIARKKQLKGSSRKKKLALIEANNSTWRDLTPDI